LVVKPGFALDDKTKVGSADTGRELCVQPCFRRDERRRQNGLSRKHSRSLCRLPCSGSTLSDRLASTKRSSASQHCPTGANLTEPVLLGACPRRRKRPPAS